MGKYEPLRAFLIGQRSERVPVNFAQLESVLGFKLPASKQYPAWWSNSPSNNPMTKVWLEAGFATEQVDIGDERLVFRRAAQMRSPVSASPQTRSGPFPGYGAMKGSVRFVEGVDLTDPADPQWARVFE